MSFCVKCGTELNNEICPKCAEKATPPQAATPQSTIGDDLRNLKDKVINESKATFNNVKLKIKPNIVS